MWCAVWATTMTLDSAHIFFFSLDCAISLLISLSMLWSTCHTVGRSISWRLFLIVKLLYHKIIVKGSPYCFKFKLSPEYESFNNMISVGLLLKTYLIVHAPCSSQCILLRVATNMPLNLSLLCFCSCFCFPLALTFQPTENTSFTYSTSIYWTPLFIRPWGSSREQKQQNPCTLGYDILMNK